MKKILGVLLSLCLGAGSLAFGIPAYASRTGETEGIGLESQEAQENSDLEETEADRPLKDVRKAAAAKGKWIRTGKYVRFRYRNGRYARSVWHRIGGKIYFFDQKGNRASGWISYGGNKYFLNKRGVMQTGWIKYQKQFYFLSQKGALQTSRWITDRGKHYYLKRNGRMATGWQKVGKKKYYLGKDGARVTGVQWIGNRWYGFRKGGAYDAKKKVPDVIPSKPMVALTFDDGPGPYTERLLGYLKKYNARATFFLVGSSVNRYPNAVRKASKMGCEIGNHSYSHPSLTGLSIQGVQQQISTTNSLVKKITGKNPTLVRPPYGAYSSAVCSAVGLPVILWNVDTRDWETRNAQATVNHIKTHVKDGDIILMHDIHSQTVDAAAQIIPWLQAQGYQLVTVSELAKYKGDGLEKGGVYTNIL